MIQHFFLNCGLAFVWCLLQGAVTLQQFIIGYLISVGIMLFFVRIFQEQLYFRQVACALKLLGSFLKELLVANWRVAKKVLSPEINVQSCMIAYPLELKSDILITLLANIITLTPGTLSVEISDDRKFLFIHVLDIADPEKEKQSIKDSFEHYLLRMAQ